jgi:hypothetical protein
MFEEKYLKFQNAPVPLIFIFCLLYYIYLFFVIFDNIYFLFVFSQLIIYNNNKKTSQSVSRWMTGPSGAAELPTLY